MIVLSFAKNQKVDIFWDYKNCYSWVKVAHTFNPRTLENKQTKLLLKNSTQIYIACGTLHLPHTLIFSLLSIPPFSC